MKQLIQMMKRKWIDGECRKLCCLCPYWEKYCRITYFPNSKIAKVYQQGYDDGYKAAKNTHK